MLILEENINHNNKCITFECSEILYQKENFYEVIIMNFDLRNAVIANLDDSNYDEIRETIIDAVESGEEKTLPGLGVIFEILWNGSNDSEKESMVARITECLRPKAV